MVETLHIDWERIMARIAEAEQKAEKMKDSEALVRRKVSSYKYPMQEMHLQYSQTKGKIYSEEEDRYLLCRLAFYGLATDDLYEKIKKDINEFPVFRFDWFIRSRTPVEIGRRCTTLISMITKELEGGQDDDEDEVMEAPPAKGKGATSGAGTPPEAPAPAKGRVSGYFERVGAFD